MISPLEPKKEEVVVKGKPVKGAVEIKESNFTEEEEATYGQRKIFVEYRPTAPEQQEIAFNLKVMYQGPEYVDPNPPPVEEVVKKPAPIKGKVVAAAVPEEPVIRMIKPEPIVFSQESGRTF